MLRLSSGPKRTVFRALSPRKSIKLVSFSTAIMATESKIVVTPSVETEFAVANLSAETAERASRVLSENHEKYHMFFNNAGFHSMTSSFPFFLLGLLILVVSSARLRYMLHGLPKEF